MHLFGVMDSAGKWNPQWQVLTTLVTQVAASPEATYVSPDDVAPDFVEKETAIEMEKEDILSKPEAIRCRSAAAWLFVVCHDPNPCGKRSHYPCLPSYSCGHSQAMYSQAAG